MAKIEDIRRTKREMKEAASFQTEKNKAATQGKKLLIKRYGGYNIDHKGFTELDHESDSSFRPPILPSTGKKGREER